LYEPFLTAAQSVFTGIEKNGTEQLYNGMLIHRQGKQRAQAKKKKG